MKSLLTIAPTFTVALLASGCVGAGPDDSGEPPAAEVEDGPTVLTDPCTGEAVGHFDAASDTLVFDDGLEVDRSDVELVDPQASLETQCQTADPDPSGMHSQALTWANGSCWVMVEDYAFGSASCSGCCHNLGGNKYYCWESCYDYSHS